jgi:hypothetical protein
MLINVVFNLWFSDLTFGSIESVERFFGNLSGIDSLIAIRSVTVHEVLDKSIRNP